MKKILTTISLLLFVTIAVALEYKPGKKIPAKEGVVGLLLVLNGKIIEHNFAWTFINTSQQVVSISSTSI